VVERDLILDASYTPTYDEIFDYLNEPAQELWQDVNIDFCNLGIWYLSYHG